MEEKKYTISQLEAKWLEFITSDEFHFLHGDIDDRKEISQWGFRWFISKLRTKAE